MINSVTNDYFISPGFTFLRILLGFEDVLSYRYDTHKTNFIFLIEESNLLSKLHKNSVVSTVKYLYASLTNNYNNILTSSDRRELTIINS